MQVACNDHDFDDLNDTSTSRVLIPVAAGETVFVQVFDDGGAGGAVTLAVRESPVFQVSTYDPYEILNYPGVGMRPGGEFLVAWREQRPGLGQGVVAGRSTTRPPHRWRRRSSSTPPIRMAPTVPKSTPTASANFVVAWGAAFGGAFVRKLDATGTPVGPEITIPVTDGYFFADVGADADGDFVVVWQEDASVGDVVAQRFDATGTPVGSPIVVQDDGARATPVPPGAVGRTRPHARDSRRNRTAPRRDPAIRDPRPPVAVRGIRAAYRIAASGRAATVTGASAGQRRVLRNAGRCWIG